MQLFHNPPPAQLYALLERCDLPTSDLEAHHLEHFLACGRADNLSGVVGLEFFGKIALLRSLAVVDEVRGLGFGNALVVGAEQYAVTKGVCELYLLTMTAEIFFQRLEYVTVDRDNVPDTIRGTQQFSGLCPDSAVVMVKKLQPVL